MLERFRADPVVASFPGAIDDKADTATLEHVATLLPDEWLEPAATGSPQRCAERVLRQFDLGVDGVIMHGATPDRAGPGGRGLPRASAPPAASTGSTPTRGADEHPCTRPSTVPTTSRPSG